MTKILIFCIKLIFEQLHVQDVLLANCTDVMSCHSDVDRNAHCLSNTCIFTRESSNCFHQHILAIAILSICLSVCHTGGSVKSGAS